MKTAVTPTEAAEMIGCTSRHIINLINDGTLLARSIGSGSNPYWRVVVHRSGMDPPRSGNHFLTIEEFLLLKTNQSIT